MVVAARCHTVDSPLAPAKAYGRNSDGMICSAAELNLGRHSGIWSLYGPPSPELTAVLGLDDVVFHLAHHPRPVTACPVRGLAAITCA